jgi:hypothetical protein
MIAAARNTESIDRALGQHDDLLAVPLDVTDQAAAQAAVAAASPRSGSRPCWSSRVLPYRAALAAVDAVRRGVDRGLRRPDGHDRRGVEGHGRCARWRPAKLADALSSSPRCPRPLAGRPTRPDRSPERHKDLTVLVNRYIRPLEALERTRRARTLGLWTHPTWEPARVSHVIASHDKGQVPGSGHLDTPGEAERSSCVQGYLVTPGSVGRFSCDAAQEARSFSASAVGVPAAAV